MHSEKSTNKDLSDRLLYGKKLWRWILTQTAYRLLLGTVGARSIIYKPIMLAGASHIFLGNRVFIREGARLECASIQGIPAQIIIGDGVSIEQNLHIVSCGTVRIGRYVTISANVSLIGSSHAFEEPPLEVSRVTRFGKENHYIDIGEFSFVGVGTTILSGCHIGKHVIVGAHSLVNRDIPDFSIAAGSPARIVKVFDHEKKCWCKPGPLTEAYV